MLTKDEFVLNNLIEQLKKTTDEDEIESLKERILEIDPDMEFTEVDEEALENETE